MKTPLYKRTVCNYGAVEPTAGNCQKVEVQEFANVEAMATSTCLKVGYARTLGFYEPGDGGGAEYIVSVSSEEPNGMDVIECGKFIAKNASVLPNVLQLGAVQGVNAVDCSGIVSYSINKYSYCCFPSGVYYLNGVVINKENFADITIEGEGKPVIRTDNGFSLNGKEDGAYAERMLGVFIRNLKLVSTGGSNTNRKGNGISFNWFGECYCDNVDFFFFDTAFSLKNGSEAAFSKMYIIGCNTGIYVEKGGYQNSDIDCISFNDCQISNCTKCCVLDSVRGVTFISCVVSNTRAEGNYGVEILSNNSSTVNINFYGCEFENNNYEFSIEVKGAMESLNINDCKFIAYDNPVIGVENVNIVNVLNSVFSQTTPLLIVINGDKMPILNINGCSPTLPLYIKDNTPALNKSVGFNMVQINHWYSMRHSVSEYIYNVQPTYNDGVVTFASSGALEFPVNEYNYKDYVLVEICGENIPSPCVYGGYSGQFIVASQSTVLQTVNNVDKRLYYLPASNLTTIRILVNSSFKLYGVGIYGANRSPLPVFQSSFASALNSSNYIGEPTKGDVMVSYKDGLAPMYVYNGSEYKGIGE